MTAVTLSATTAAGRSVGVSVPFDGQVWYDVDGFHEEATSTDTGAPACDHAETQLGDLHHILGERFGVVASEVQWEGKDPNRVLRGADSIGGPAATHGRTRAK